MDEKAEGAAPVPKDVTEKILCAVALEMAGLSSVRVDQALHFPNGTTAALRNRYPERWKRQVQRHSDEVVDRFYRSRISLLEHLIGAAPYSVQYADELQRDESQDAKLRLQAADKIRDWVSLFLKNKHSDATRELLPEALAKHAEKAAALEQQLYDVMEKQTSDLEN